MATGMKVADLGVDPHIAAILKDHGIEELYAPQERAAPLALEGKSLVLATRTIMLSTTISYTALHGDTG